MGGLRELQRKSPKHVEAGEQTPPFSETKEILLRLEF